MKTENISNMLKRNAQKVFGMVFRGAGIMTLIFFLCFALIIILMSSGVSAYYSDYTPSYSYYTYTPSYSYYPPQYESYSTYQPDGVEYGYGFSEDDHYTTDYYYSPHYSYNPSYSYGYYEEPSCYSYNCHDYYGYDDHELSNSEEFHILTHHVPASAIVDTSGWDYWKTPDSRTSNEAYGDGSTRADASSSDWGNKETYNVYDYTNDGAGDYVSGSYYSPRYDAEQGFWNWRF